jgi:hypothetical protein
MEDESAENAAGAANAQPRTDENGTGSGSGFYRLNANSSSASIFEDVEMAHDEVCST